MGRGGAKTVEAARPFGDSGSPLLCAHAGTTEIWNVVNKPFAGNQEDHKFHIHQTKFEILAVDDPHGRIEPPRGGATDRLVRIAQLDQTRTVATKGRTKTTTVGDQGPARVALVHERETVETAIASHRIEKAKVEGERKAVEVDLGPVRYLATLLGSTDEQTRRWLVDVVALLLDRSDRKRGGARDQMSGPLSYWSRCCSGALSRGRDTHRQPAGLENLRSNLSPGLGTG